MRWELCELCHGGVPHACAAVVGTAPVIRPSSFSMNSRNAASRNVAPPHKLVGVENGAVIGVEVLAYGLERRPSDLSAQKDHKLPREGDALLARDLDTVDMVRLSHFRV